MPQPSTFAQEFIAGAEPKFRDELNARFNDPSREGHRTQWDVALTVAPGRKFDKIVQQSWIVGENMGQRGQRSVHCFIDRATGEVYKAATWAKPADKVRFHSVALALKEATIHGGYLYLR